MMTDFTPVWKRKNSPLLWQNLPFISSCMFWHLICTRYPQRALHGSILLISYGLFFKFCRLNRRFGKQKPSWHILNALQYYLSRSRKSHYQDFHMIFQFIFTSVSASAILIHIFCIAPTKTDCMKSRQWATIFVVFSRLFYEPFRCNFHQ